MREGEAAEDHGAPQGQDVVGQDAPGGGGRGPCELEAVGGVGDSGRGQTLRS